jgi:DNA helicase-2/ATP-dependent DNA helicase PcrA
MILALTFTNKARDNLSARMREFLGPRWGQRIRVTNFHGVAARVISAHGRVLDIAADLILPEEPWRLRQRKELGINYKNADPFETALRDAKRGPFCDDEVMERLLHIGHRAAIAYEERLRAEGRLDHDDLLRHAARLLAVPDVSRLYQTHFGMVMVDEVQDLSLLQYDIIRAVGDDRVTYAGDPAQGIYAFAGADPDGVFARIRALDPEIVEFNQSYRSAPAVLAAVNRLAREMGSTELECGEAGKWPDQGRVIYVERGNTDDEAAAILRLVEGITTQDSDATIGVVGRRGTRMAQLREAAGGSGVAFEDWTLPTHVPNVVALLNRYVRQAAAVPGSPDEALDALECLCREAVDPADAMTVDELASACAALREMIAHGLSLTEAVATCRATAAPDAPVAAGLHLLTGHRGKGQEFDWVFVIGLEQGHVPDFRNPADPEELRVLHVMVSRARYGLVFTYCRQTWGWDTTPSPWLALLRAVETSVDIV